MAPVLGYWKIRGLATPIRLLLEQAGADYEEKLYECGPPPDFDRSSWLNEKFTLGLDFPNLPYYMDDDVKLSQSHVILRYLARKHKLDGNNEQERVRTDLVATQVMDFHMDYARTIAYNPEHEKNKETYEKNLADRLKALAEFLGDRQFVAGDHVTYGDFVLYEYLEGQNFYKPGVLKDHPTLEKFVERVNELESVKKYFNSSRAIKAPFNGAPAYIGGPYSDQIAKK
uniref:Glutathione S-transferase n=1 Tax=Aceria tosichella TaxID=561515 RepID=A0A6G1SP38_9ACAR